MTENPRRLTSLRRSVPPHVEAACAPRSRKLPADRWSSAREFAEALRSARPVAVMSGAPRRDRIWIASAVAVAATLLAGIEGLLLRRAPAPANARDAAVSVRHPDSERFLPTTPAIPFSISCRLRAESRTSAPDRLVLAIYVRGLDDMQSRALPNTDGVRSHRPSRRMANGLPRSSVVESVKTPADGGPSTTVRSLNGALNAGMIWADPDTIIASVRWHARGESRRTAERR